MKTRMRWVRQVIRNRERRITYKVLVGKAEGKRPFERPRRRWKYIIKIGL
jgi:hypothetical protein